MEKTKANKKELIEWIEQLDEQAMLVTLQSIKKKVKRVTFGMTCRVKPKRQLIKQKIKSVKEKEFPTKKSWMKFGSN